MLEGRHVRVVVPAYNEELLIERVVTTMPAIVDQIIVVDDCSTDKTAEVLACLETRLGDRLRVVRHKENCGVGAAIVTGYKAAVQDAVGNDLVAVMAGDAQMDPDELPRLLMPLAKHVA